MAEKERIIKDFLELSAIDSVSFKEREFADVLKQKLELLGIKAHEDSVSDKIGSTAGNIRKKESFEVTEKRFSGQTISPALWKY